MTGMPDPSDTHSPDREALPTEPGWYLDQQGDVWRIDGERRTAIAAGYEHLTARLGMKLTRLHALNGDERAMVVDALRDVPDIDRLMAEYRPSRQQEIDERLALAERLESGR